MSRYHFYPMTKDRALQISKWQYEYPYSMYNMDSSEDSILELMNEEYYYALLVLYAQANQHGSQADMQRASILI